MRKASKKLYRIVFATAGKIGSCNIEDTIVIAGSPRSGTTLLLETFNKLPGYKAVNEPLVKRRVREKHGFHLRSYIQPGQPASRQQKYLEEVLRGQMDLSARRFFEKQTAWERIIKHGSRNKLLVKFCRINRMLPWFAEQFSVRGIVFIIRHPCAVVNSMLRFGQWDKWDWDYILMNKIAASAFLLEDLPDSVKEVFAPVFERVSTKTEALALMWCLDHYVPLIHSNNHPWILVPYERLVLHKFQELTRITDSLGVEMNAEMLGTLNKPSSSVKDYLHENKDGQISKWKQQLSSRQIDEILSIVKEVKLYSIYSEASEPHYGHLDLLQKPLWQLTSTSPFVSSKPAREISNESMKPIS